MALTRRACVSVFFTAALSIVFVALPAGTAAPEAECAVSTGGSDLADVYAAGAGYPLEKTLWTPLFFLDSPRHGKASAEVGVSTSVTTEFALGSKWVTLSSSSEDTDSESAAISLEDGNAGAYYQLLHWTLHGATCTGQHPYYYVDDYTPNGQQDFFQGDLSGGGYDTDVDNCPAPDCDFDGFMLVASEFDEAERSLCTSNAEVTWMTETEKVFVVVAGFTYSSNGQSATFEGQSSFGVSHKYTYAFPSGYCWEADALGKGKGYAFNLLGQNTQALCESVRARGLQQWGDVPHLDVGDCGTGTVDTGDPLEAFYPDQVPLPHA